MKNTKTVKKTEWKAWKLVSEPTKEHGQIRKDESGRMWEWYGSLCKITVKRYVGGAQ